MRRLFVAAAVSLAFQPALADCVDDASTYHGVNASILRAILWNESSMRPDATNRNKNGTVDVGIAQINSMHFDALREHGIEPEHLMNACVGTYVAAWHLRKQLLQHGNTWKAIGAYHSVTPHFNQSYANRVHATLVRWKVVLPGPAPFPSVAPLPSAAATTTAPAPAAGALSPINALPRD